MSGAEVEVRRPTGALAVTDDQTAWNEQQRAALVQIGVGDAPLGDQLVLLHQSQRTGLDPFAKQIYMIGRNDNQAPGGKKWTIQTGIDGYRVIARRTADRRGETFGYEDTLWCGTNGNWIDVWLFDYPPAAAKVTVLRNGARFSAVARFSSYAQTKYGGGFTRQWATMPDVMIAKCAEALALRKAYPQDLAGIFTDEEMMQADNPPQAIDGAPAHAPPPNGHPNGNGHHPNGAANGDGHAPPAWQPPPPPVRTDEERAEFEKRWATEFDAATDGPALNALLSRTRAALGTGHIGLDRLAALEGLIRDRWEGVPVTQKQLAHLHARLGEVGITADDEIRAICWHCIENCAGSRRNLNYGQYKTILGGVEAAIRGGEIAQLCADAMRRDWDPETGQEIVRTPAADPTGDPASAMWDGEPRPGTAGSQFADPAEVAGG